MIPVDIVIPTLNLAVGERAGRLAIATTGHTDVKLIVVLDELRQGFTKTVNRGIRQSRPEADVCLLNDDVSWFQYSWLRILQYHLHSDKSFGLAGPSGYSSTKPVKDGRLGQAGCRSVRHIPFWCVVIKRSTISRFGLLDEAYIHYASDNQYCDNLISRGLLNVWVKDVWLDHRQHGSGLIKHWADKDRSVYRRRGNRR